MVQGIANSETPVMANYDNVIVTMRAHNIIMTTSWFQSPESTPPQGQGHSTCQGWPQTGRLIDFLGTQRKANWEQCLALQHNTQPDQVSR